MIKAEKPERIASLMRHQVAVFMVRYYHWIREYPYQPWRPDIGEAMRRTRRMWAVHLAMNPLPEYPSC